jgi:O-antigen/teichoic acid export membrane protein
VISLLFRNLNHGQIIVKNTLWLGVAVGLAGLGDFAVTVYVIRRLGPTEYGTFAFALSFASLFSAFFDFGLSTAVTREFAADSAGERAFPALVLLKACIGLLAIAVVATGGLLIAKDAVSRHMIMILAVYIMFMEMANLFYALYRSRQQMETEALFRGVYACALVGFVAIAMTRDATITSVGFAYLGAAITVVAANIVKTLLDRDRRLPVRPSINLSIWREFLHIGLYIALAKVASDFMVNLGSVLLGSMGRVTDIGLYNAANKVNGLVLFPMGLAASAIFPALVSSRDTSPERLVRYWNEWARYTLLFSVLLSFLLFAKAADIIGVLYRQSFHPSVVTLRILALAVGMVYVQNLYYQILLVFNRQQQVFRAVLNAAAINLVVNLVLVPRVGLYGVAIAWVATQSALLCQYVMLTGRLTPVKPVPAPMIYTLIISTASGAVTAVAVSLFPGGRGGLLASIPAGMLIYGVSAGILVRMSKHLTLKPFTFRGGMDNR